MGKYNWRSFFLFCTWNYVFAHENMEQCRLCPQNYGAIQTLPSKITEPSYFASQNHRAFILCPGKLWSSADFAPQNHRDIVSGAKITTSSYFFFCKSMLFLRYMQALGPLFKEKIFCVMIPLTSEPIMLFLNPFVLGISVISVILS